MSTQRNKGGGINVVIKPYESIVNREVVQRKKFFIAVFIVKVGVGIPQKSGKLPVEPVKQAQAPIDAIEIIWQRRFRNIIRRAPENACKINSPPDVHPIRQANGWDIFLAVVDCRVFIFKDAVFKCSICGIFRTELLFHTDIGSVAGIRIASSSDCQIIVRNGVFCFEELIGDIKAGVASGLPPSF